MQRTRVLATGAAVSLLAACGSQPHQPSAALASPSQTPEVSAAASAPANGASASTVPFRCTSANTTKLDTPAPQDGPRLSTAFVPLAAYLCFEQQRSYAHDGVWLARVEERLVGDLVGLRTALLRPDPPTPTPPPGTELACAASLVIRPTLNLVSASGQVLRPRPPTDYCGDQLPGVAAAVSALRHVTVSVIKVRQLETQQRVDHDNAAIAIGCQPQWKDEFAHGMVPTTLSPGGPLAHAPSMVSLCRYRTTAGDPIDLAFVAGRRLTAGQTATVLDALTLPGKPGGCNKAHVGVVVVQGRSGITAATLELGGCSRVVREPEPRSPVGRADFATIAHLVPRP